MNRAFSKPQGRQQPETIFASQRARVRMAFAVLAYVVALHLAYKYFAAEQFWYLGFGPYSREIALLLFSVVAAIVPTSWTPLHLTRPSVFFYYIQYFFIFVPTVVVLPLVNKPSLRYNDVILLTIAMTAGLWIMSQAFRRTSRSWPIHPSPATRKLIWNMFMIFSAAMMLYVFVQLSANFTIVNLNDIYGVRSQAASLTDTSGGYARLWLTSVTFPFLMANGLFGHRRLLFLIGSLGYLYMFAIAGNKSHLLAPLILLVVYVWSTRLQGRFTYMALGAAVLAILVLPIRLISPTLGFWFGLLTTIRMQLFPGLLFAQYFDFTQEFGFTYWSQSKAISWLVPYPYPEPLPRMIGWAYTDAPSLAQASFSNAGAWASDGVASFGVAGILLASAVIALVFVAIDRATVDLSPAFVSVVSTFAALNFANVPISTAVVSGGIGLIIALMVLGPRVPTTDGMILGFSSSRVYPPMRIHRGTRAAGHSRHRPDQQNPSPAERPRTEPL